MYFQEFLRVLESFGAVSVLGCISIESPQAAWVISVSNETLSQLLTRYQSRILAMSTCYNVTHSHSHPSWNQIRRSIRDKHSLNLLDQLKYTLLMYWGSEFPLNKSNKTPIFLHILPWIPSNRIRIWLATNLLLPVTSHEFMLKESRKVQ